jgi:Family of unknown function (DUF6166)
MKVYIGRITSGDRRVVDVIDGTAKGKRVRKLKLRLDLHNHSPTGFNWGYGGSGPAQLALALLADALGDDERAVRLHQRYKFMTIGALDKDRGWHLTDGDIFRAVAQIEADKRVLQWANRPDQPEKGE